MYLSAFNISNAKKKAKCNNAMPLYTPRNVATHMRCCTVDLHKEKAIKRNRILIFLFLFFLNQFLRCEFKRTKYVMN